MYEFFGYRSDEDYLDRFPEECSFLTSPAPYKPYNYNNVQRRVNALKKLQKQYDEVTKIWPVEGVAGSSEDNLKPQHEDLYLKRFDIINGVVEVGGDGTQLSEGTSTSNVTEDVKGIPDFWRTALEHAISNIVEISNADGRLLSFLKDIRVRSTEEFLGFTLEFLFDCNPYFKNSLLSKTYHFLEKRKKFYITKATGTEIEWYPGQSTMKTIQRMRPRRGSQDRKPVIKYEICESFFHFFKTREGSNYLVKDENQTGKSTRETGDDVGSDDDGRLGGEDVSSEDDDQDTDSCDFDEVEEEFMEWEDDCKIGCILRSEVIPQAILWYMEEVQRYRHPYGSDESDDEVLDGKWGDLSSDAKSVSDEDYVGEEEDWSSGMYEKCVGEIAGSSPSKPKEKEGHKYGGVLKFFNDLKGYGFIIPCNGGHDIFVHQTSIHQTLVKGDAVEYRLEIDDHGRPKAVDVKKMNRSHI